MKDEHRLFVHENTNSPVAEAYRVLRANIRFSKADKTIKTILFTSASPGEAKSTIPANTAAVLAQSGKRVIIVDCEIRKPTLHKIFQCSNYGLTNALTEDVPVARLLQDTIVRNLRLLPSGPVPPDPSELLSFPKMAELLAELAADADYVIIDAPPALAVTDTCLIASLVDAVILVLDAGAVRSEFAQKAKRLIEKANGYLLGVVLNRVQLKKKDIYYYHYYADI